LNARKKQLIAITDVEKQIAECVQVCKEHLRALPNSLAPALENKARNHIAKLLAEKIDEGLNKLSQAFEKMGDE
jgi:hypothetical protein